MINPRDDLVHKYLLGCEDVHSNYYNFITNCCHHRYCHPLCFHHSIQVSLILFFYKYIISNQLRSKFQNALTTRVKYSCFLRQMEAADRLDKIRKRLNLSEIDPIPANQLNDDVINWEKDEKKDFTNGNKRWGKKRDRRHFVILNLYSNCQLC